MAPEIFFDNTDKRKNTWKTIMKLRGMSRVLQVSTYQKWN